MDLDIYSGRRSLMVTMVPSARMIVMFMIIPMLHAAGRKYSQNAQEGEQSNYPL
jgi:hypothetical protein